MNFTTLNQKTLIQIVSAMLISTISGISFAGPIITQWNYSTDAIFTDSGFSGTSGTQTSSDYELSWGQTGGFFQDSDGAISDGERSALTIGNGATNSLTDGGPATGSVETVIGGVITDPSTQVGLGINISHWNNPIASTFDTLISGAIKDTLSLTAVSPVAGLAFDAPTLIFDFLFQETPNAGPCAGGTAPPCGDLFGIIAVPTLNQAFMYDDNEYFASVLVTDASGGVSPINNLLDEECTALGLGAGCQGWRTDEVALTTVQFALSISTAPVFVPEPAAIALMAMGLLGFGYGRKKR